MVLNTKLYDILEIKPTSTHSDIKSAYRKLAIKHHPDKGGDENKFKELTHAYEILSDNQKRSNYDISGNESNTAQPNPSNFFKQFFNFQHGFSGFNQQNNQFNAPDIITHVNSTIQQVFNGDIIPVHFDRSDKCDKCNETGSNSGKSYTCNNCNGIGQKVHIVQLGPGIVQQIATPCDNCNGNGNIINKQDLCSLCNGKKTKINKCVYNLTLPKGVLDGTKLMLNEGNYHNKTRSNLIIIIHIDNNSIFKINNNNLHTIIDISLTESLLGFTRTIKHLNNEEIQITHTNSIKHKYIQIIKDKGMPIHNHYGELHIEFNVLYPTAEFISSNANNIKTLLTE
jgi:DnaJ family protein A protein 2